MTKWDLECRAAGHASDVVPVLNKREGSWSVASETVRGVTHQVIPEWIHGRLALACDCDVGRRMHHAQVPCVHAGVVCRVLESVDAVVWVSSRAGIDYADDEGARRVGLPASGAASRVGPF